MLLTRTSGARERAVLLLGPPGGGKSFIFSLFDHAAAPIFYGATTTPKGLVRYTTCPWHLYARSNLSSIRNPHQVTSISRPSGL
ncbi:hypothetical protein ODS41_00145 [Pyrobaculum sp. 3827-6]|jgi:hypothetical protein|uniref:hypothetical protein n=1 Tax=Pyrobaculum sp. 3827-6 TaxID=2983604 RepID=UPI0021D9F3E7|nr:hypothetical protein [Pyrobaculum sp. 3827-6]MCU7786343.1 hypothetical protein [Pyrobaculum sp. 3827-6]